MFQNKEMDALLEKNVNKLIYQSSTLSRELAIYLQVITGDSKTFDIHEYYHALNHLKAILDRVYGPYWFDYWIKSNKEIEDDKIQDNSERP